MFASWFFACLTATSLVAADCAGCSNVRTGRSLTVETTNGPITGHIAPRAPSQCVIEYLGIPYAKPPVGDLRFAAPHPLDIQGPYIAANFGADCPLTPSKPVDYPGFTHQAQRIISYFTSGTGTPQSEDCLTLNIWAKATPAAATAKKPVVVFFYGGSKFPMGGRALPNKGYQPLVTLAQGSPPATLTPLFSTASILPTPRISLS